MDRDIIPTLYWYATVPMTVYTGDTSKVKQIYIVMYANYDAKTIKLMRSSVPMGTFKTIEEINEGLKTLYNDGFKVIKNIWKTVA